MLRICIVTGARPNFMKVAPIIHAIRKAADAGKSVSYRLIYAGAASDVTLEPSLFSDLEIPQPDAFLSADSVSLNELAGRVMVAFEKELEEHPADVVIAVDDLTSTMAASIVTKKKGVMLAHLVAGTRSFDINMPKEVNRLVIDGLSDLLFTAGESNNFNASKEGAAVSKVYTVGNILLDTLRNNFRRFRKPSFFDEMSLHAHGYIVMTVNRRVLLGDEQKMKNLINTAVSAAGDVPIIAPLHDYAAGVFAAANNQVKIVPPQAYLEFGYLTSQAMGIITDSGNVAEEATFNGVPCITLNNYTEHIETVNIGTNVLVGEDVSRLGDAVRQLVSGNWKRASIPDRWDGRTAERIISILLSQHEN